MFTYQVSNSVSEAVMVRHAWCNSQWVHFEISMLVYRLAQANRDMAELNSRLVNAAFGSAFSGALPEMFKPSVSGLDHTDCSSQLDRQSSNPAGSSSGEQASIAGLPPGIPLDPFYDE